MPSDLELLSNWLSSHEGDLLADTQAMLRIPSVKEDEEPGTPYGKSCAQALDFALALANQYGFSTRNLESKVGYAEFGKGDPLIVSLGHLDVVPVGPGWKFEPFSATISDGYIYSRGAVDDKGPTMASFYAARAIKECFPELAARIRVVFGCDEESGMTCVERYNDTEEVPTFGIAPDSMWPLVHAEKGICGLFIEVPVHKGPIELHSLSGGDRLNIVIDQTKAMIRVDSSALSEVQEKVQNSWDRNVKATWQTENTLEIECIGKAAHGSTPFYGDSAATRMFRFLAEISPIESQPYFAYLLNMTHPSGVGLGIHGQDETSYDLTSNTGVISFANGTLALAINVRYPVTWKGEHVQSMCEEFLAKESFGARLVDFHDSPSLYFPLEHPLVSIITKEYQDMTGDMTPPGVMGGGTYARKIANTVSVGTGWPGDGEAHQTNEKLKVDHLFKMSQIYARILLRLAQAATTP
jgi:succinyl-diaminopimelate desuccinylase